MTFDECIPYPYSYSDTEASLQGHQTGQKDH